MLLLLIFMISMGAETGFSEVYVYIVMLFLVPLVAWVFVLAVVREVDFFVVSLWKGVRDILGTYSGMEWGGYNIGG